MEDDLDAFDYWCGAYRDEPSTGAAETMRLLMVMCQAGNRHALDYLDALRSGREHLPYDSAPDLLVSALHNFAVVEPGEPFAFDDLDGEQWGVLIGALDSRAPAADQSFSEPDHNSYPPNWQ